MTANFHYTKENVQKCVTTKLHTLNELEYLLQNPDVFTLELIDADFCCYISKIVSPFDTFYVATFPHPFF